MGPQAAAKHDKITSQMTLSERADHLEEQMMHELDRIVTKSVFSHLTDGQVEMEGGAALQAKYPGKYFNMGADPRLPPMPDKPTLLDYFKYRFASTNHLLQSGALALKNGHSEKVVLACLLHDIAVVSFIRCDHGYWGAQMIAPYVDEEVSEAIRMHQALRFFPDESMGYKYPDMYLKYFGAGLSAGALHRRGVQARPRQQVLRDLAADLRERRLRLRSQRQGQPRAVRGHHRPQLQAAEGRPRLGPQPVRAHVAHHHVADAVPL